MQDLSHLKNSLVVKDTTISETKTKRKTKQEEIAELQGLTIRVYQNGEVYPSRELTNTFKLEYGRKEEAHKTYGFDIVDSKDWKPMENMPRTLFLALVPKTEPKVDLFAGVRYDNGNPKNSVLTQGTTSERLVKLLVDFGYFNSRITYEEVAINGDSATHVIQQPYLDLILMDDYAVRTEDNIAYVPKTVERGVEKGGKTYERRENAIFYPVVVAERTAEQIAVETTTRKVEETQ